MKFRVTLEFFLTGLKLGVRLRGKVVEVDTNMKLSLKTMSARFTSGHQSHSRKRDFQFAYSLTSMINDCFNETKYDRVTSKLGRINFALNCLKIRQGQEQRALF